MEIEKNGKIYQVKENKTVWALSCRMGSVTVEYNVSKADCATFESLKAFVAENIAF